LITLPSDEFFAPGEATLMMGWRLDGLTSALAKLDLRHPSPTIPTGGAQPRIAGSKSSSASSPRPPCRRKRVAV
jgi:hypothetical protein